VYGPNRRFLTYISEVLPSLGENDVQLATLPDLVGVEATLNEPGDLARIKGRSQLAQGRCHSCTPRCQFLRLETGCSAVGCARVADAMAEQASGALRGDGENTEGLPDLAWKAFR
jgi:hypothetical protein